MKEPEFDQIDREQVEALLDLRADTHSCGGLLSETTVADGHGYDIDHQTCFRCLALAQQQEELEEKARKGGVDDHGNKIVPSAELWTVQHLPPRD